MIDGNRKWKNNSDRWLFLLIGQSNMAGRGALDREWEEDPRIVSLDADNQWVKAAEPLHFDKPEIAGVGPGLTFARTLLSEMEAPEIGLIPCAVGGTKIERWIKGGDLYDSAVKRTRIGQETGELKGILWIQGESDSEELQDANPYRERFYTMVRDLRSDVRGDQVPFIAGKIGGFLSPSEYPYVEYIQSAIEEGTNALPFYNWVDSGGLKDGGDSLHFDSDSAREFGRRFAWTFIQLVRNGNK